MRGAPVPERGQGGVCQPRVLRTRRRGLCWRRWAKQPLITADMHLGEGTGAVASIPLWDMALAVYQNCYSFAEGGIEPYTPQC